ncbi:MAG: hypothetical protein JXN61_10455 [Sedimentisphaerales bacterium]|nr:hypothetical protein [Sedimentisphaerales bacterium]
MGMNMREYAGIVENYSCFNREERNFAAVLYYLLLKPGNMERFLELIDKNIQIVQEQFGVYVEYSYLRDLWNKLQGNDQKRGLIKSFLTLKCDQGVFEKSIVEFNRFFGAVPKASEHDIQSPGTWSLPSFAEHISDNDDLLNVCKFKWSFKAKPDIVIHTSKDSAICIEAKSESGEGSYPAKSEEKRIFEQRGIRRIGQTELQKYFMEDLLGVRTHFVFLIKKGKPSSESHKIVTWKKVFDCLDVSDSPLYILESIETATKGADSNPSSPVERSRSGPNYRGQLPFSEMVRKCRTEGDAILVGYNAGGVRAMRNSPPAHIRERMYKWDFKDDPIGKKNMNNWMTGNEFLEIVSEKFSGSLSDNMF